MISVNDIEEIMDEFDFEIVHRTMRALDWKWAGSDGTPTIGDLRRMARELLKDLIKNKYEVTGSGGLYAYRMGATVGLRFELTSYEMDIE